MPLSSRAIRNFARVRRHSRTCSRTPTQDLPPVYPLEKLKRPHPCLLSRQLQSRQRRPSSSHRPPPNSKSSNCQRTINLCRLPLRLALWPLNTIRSVTRFHSSRSPRRQTLRIRFNLCNSSLPTSYRSNCKRCRRTLHINSSSPPCSCSTLPCSPPSLFSEYEASKL